MLDESEFNMYNLEDFEEYISQAFVEANAIVNSKTGWMVSDAACKESVNSTDL